VIMLLLTMDTLFAQTVAEDSWSRHAPNDALNLTAQEMPEAQDEHDSYVGGVYLLPVSGATA
jgi:hypothetical protein